MATIRPSGLYSAACGARELAFSDRRSRCADAAAFTMAGRSSKVSGCSGVGLPTQLTAPSSSADIAAAAPRPVCPEIMTTGNGRRRMTFSRNAKPSIFGISTSRVITSGLSALIASRACSGSAASPTTSIIGSWDRTAAIRKRIVAESSTTSTRTGLMPASRRPIDRSSSRRREGGRSPAR